MEKANINLSTFNERLKQTRVERGLTQRNLGAMLKNRNNATEKNLRADNTLICQYENGLREPSISKIIKLCQILDVSSDYILGLSDEKRPPKPKQLSDYSTDELMKEVLRRWL